MKQKNMYISTAHVSNFPAARSMDAEELDAVKMFSIHLAAIHHRSSEPSRDQLEKTNDTIPQSEAIPKCANYRIV
jgi:hypothetical protein